MNSSHQVSRPRCLAVAGGAAVAYAALLAWLLPTVATGPSAVLDEALVRLCAALALVAAGWLWLATTATVLGALSGRARAVGAPAALRRIVLAACGVAATGALLATGPAHATPGQQHEDRVVSAASAVAGLPLPDRATASAPAPPRAPAAAVRRTVVVAPGDSLWSIAARTLPRGAGDAEIEAAWRRIYDVNRAAIGPDPDLIRPAQRLEVLP
ncbi:LysM peptidoglycan-binding domain-containing protein [Nocardioides sp. URHA0020]|uniref:LysM peptidoglycan-binding domain-containing protein n=1 Tax=Nocardioides sp. URHA0020 TaxID=1380392 RepID=UPI000685C540|nr:LysM domain-containing protein [Nocardioides sp. URHA0020]